MPDDVVQLIDLHELVGRSEIAERAGIRLTTVDTWRRRYPTFPEPIGAISGTPLWLWPVIAQWMDDTPREVGRPATAPRAVTTPLPSRLARAIRTEGDLVTERHEGETA